MEAVQAYQASDGVLFKTADACQDYEVSLVWRNRIDEFQKRAAEDKCNGYIVDNARISAENKKLRHLLFVAHGSSEHYLYGDDGERTCNTCMVDFNRDSAAEIERKIHEHNMRKLAQILPE